MKWMHVLSVLSILNIIILINLNLIPLYHEKLDVKLTSQNLLLQSDLQVIDEYEKDLHFVEIDIEEDPEIAEAAGIMGTPCVQFFKEKEMLK